MDLASGWSKRIKINLPHDQNLDHLNSSRTWKSNHSTQESQEVEELGHINQIEAIPAAERLVTNSNINVLINTRTSRLRLFGPALGPLGLLDNVLQALRPLRPCDFFF